MAGESKGSGGVALGRDFTIQPYAALPEFDSAEAQAFRVNQGGKLSENFIAYVCRGEAPQRREILSTLKKMRNANCINPHEWGVVDWPADNMRRFVIVTDAPTGQRVMPDDNQPLSVRLTDDEIISRFMRPMFDLLKDLHGAGQYCGGIRPTNLFTSQGSKSSFSLGEFYTSPPAYSQPALYEPTGRAMADPAGRGDGRISDDLYALGITCMVLFLGQNPLAGLSEEDIIRRKIEFGTYHALMGSKRLSGPLTEPLRGLLADRGSARWGMKDLELWISGRRLSPKQTDPPRKASRPYEFDGAVAQHAAMLSLIMTGKPAKAAQKISDGSVEGWLRRAAAQNNIAEAVSAITSHFGQGNQEDRMVAQVLMALDPSAPIRLGGVSVMPSGIGTAMAAAFYRETDIQPYVKIILSELPVTWFSLQDSLTAEENSVIRLFDKARGILERPDFGEGPERAVYELCRSAPCYSLNLARDMVMAIEELLPALEKLSARPDRPHEPMDRHIAGFIMARGKGVASSTMRIAGDRASSEDRRVGAMLAVLAGLQRQHGPENLPGLAAWCLAMCQPRIDAVRNSKLRERMTKKLRQAADQGNLVLMSEVVDDQASLEMDDHGFKAARQSYQNMERRLELLNLDLAEPSRLAMSGGSTVAVVISTILATLFGGLIYLLMGAML